MTASADHSTDRDVLDVLTTDHREMLELIEQILASGDPAQRRDLADSLISEVVRHSVAEEMYVYPSMRTHLPDGDAVVEHDTQEHKQIERLLKELEAADAAEPRFAELVRELEGALREHASDEEDGQFPRLRTQVSEAVLVDLKAKVETAKKVAPTRPHPSAPNAELFHKMVGPGVGLVDRLRDRLTGRSA